MKHFIEEPGAILATGRETGGRRVTKRRGSTAAYHLRLALPILLVTAYPFLAFYGPHQGRAEFYPFFSWNLFASSSSKKADVVIIVREIGG